MQTVMHTSHFSMAARMPCTRGQTIQKPLATAAMPLSSRCQPAASLRHSCGISGHSSGLAALRTSRSAPASRGTRVVTRASEDPPITDRVVAAACYLLPLCDGIRYGKFALAQYPFIRTLLGPLDPLIKLYTSLPFGSLLVFFAIYLGVSNNRERFGRWVRFNAMQAILLDIILIFPGLLEQVLKPPVNSPLGLTVYINLYNAIFFFLLISWLLASGNCILGRTTRLPLVGNAADQQTPF